MRKLLLFVTIGFALSAALIYLFGDSGLSSYRNLAEYRGRLDANVAELGSIHAKLTEELEYLKLSPSATKALAGDLGLYGENEMVIRFAGSASRRVSYEAGKLLRLPKRREVKNLTFKIMGAGVAAFLAFATFLLRGLARRKIRGDYRGG
jgi:hypothetical protein